MRRSPCATLIGDHLRLDSDTIFHQRPSQHLVEALRIPLVNLDQPQLLVPVDILLLQLQGESFRGFFLVPAFDVDPGRRQVEIRIQQVLDGESALMGMCELGQVKP